eukprot:546416_1
MSISNIKTSDIKKTMIVLFICGACLRMAAKYNKIDPLIKVLKTPKKVLLTSFLLYILWIFTYDYNAGSLSTRKSQKFVKLCSIPANYFKKHYFPAILLRDFPIKSNMIDPTKKYIIAFHPHGIMGVSFLLHFLLSTDAFPGLNYRIVTISFNFWMPIFREILLFLGLANASRTTINALLSQNISVGIVIGGAAEAMNARPGTNDLTLSTRIGFVQAAIESGADIIPVFTFGENDLYQPIISNKPDSILNKWQLWLKKKIGFIIPLVIGHWGVLPQRRPMHTVIGKVIKVEKITNPTLEDILLVHKVYIERLQDLYDRYKHLYPQRKNELNVVDKVSERKMEKWKMAIDKAKL